MFFNAWRGDGCMPNAIFIDEDPNQGSKSVLILVENILQKQ